MCCGGCYRWPSSPLSSSSGLRSYGVPSDRRAPKGVRVELGLGGLAPRGRAGTAFSGSGWALGGHERVPRSQRRARDSKPQESVDPTAIPEVTGRVESPRSDVSARTVDDVGPSVECTDHELDVLEGDGDGARAKTLEAARIPPSSASDPLESALAAAAAAGRWDVVSQLARELEARRLASSTNVVTLKPGARRG